jgi:hypothetical protein
MNVDLIFKPIVKSKWRKIYLMLLFFFSTCTLFFLRKEFTVHSLYMFITYFILFYLLIIFPISFFYFTIKWCWRRHGFLSWEEFIKIIIYALILFITFLNYYVLRYIFDPNYSRIIND